MGYELGKLIRVDPRTVWKHEAHDFTPWLAAHIDLLGETLGLELEVVMLEGAVGDFAVDIVATDLGRDRRVVIENQLEATDHSHLGQLITYAAGREATVIVWVSREFREEHRQALDWLNRAATGTEYFGVVLELLQVDDSKPAPNLRLVASPNNWSRASAKSNSQNVTTDKGTAYQTFFQLLIDELRDVHHFTNARAGQPQNWYTFSSGTRGLQYGASFAAKGRLRCELYIDFGDEVANEAALLFLKADAAAIEADFGEPLSWETLETKRACRIACYRNGSIEDADENLESHRRWTVEHLLKFKAVLGPRLPGVAKKVQQVSSASANGGGDAAKASLADA